MLNKLSGYELTNTDGRDYPLDLVYPDTETDRISVTWDTSLAIDSVVTPGCDSSAFRFGQISMVSSLQGDTVTIELLKKYLTYEVATDEFPDFSAWRKRLRSVISRQVKFFLSTD